MLVTGIFQTSNEVVFVNGKGGNQKTQIVAEIKGFWGFLPSFITLFLLFFWKIGLFLENGFEHFFKRPFFRFHITCCPFPVRHMYKRTYRQVFVTPVETDGVGNGVFIVPVPVKRR